LGTFKFQTIAERVASCLKSQLQGKDRQEDHRLRPSWGKNMRFYLKNEQNQKRVEGNISTDRVSA
jgi:hypothetical protein